MWYHASHLNIVPRGKEALTEPGGHVLLAPKPNCQGPCAGVCPGKARGQDVWKV